MPLPFLQWPVLFSSYFIVCLFTNRGWSTPGVKQTYANQYRQDLTPAESRQLTVTSVPRLTRYSALLHPVFVLIYSIQNESFALALIGTQFTVTDIRSRVGERLVVDLGQGRTALAGFPVRAHTPRRFPCALPVPRLTRTVVAVCTTGRQQRHRRGQFERCNHHTQREGHVPPNANTGHGYSSKLPCQPAATCLMLNNQSMFVGCWCRPPGAHHVHRPGLQATPGGNRCTGAHLFRAMGEHPSDPGLHHAARTRQLTGSRTSQPSARSDDLLLRCRGTYLSSLRHSSFLYRTLNTTHTIRMAFTNRLACIIFRAGRGEPRSGFLLEAQSLRPPTRYCTSLPGFVPTTASGLMGSNHCAHCVHTELQRCTRVRFDELDPFVPPLRGTTHTTHARTHALWLVLMMSPPLSSFSRVRRHWP